MVLITDKFHKASSGTRAEATTLTAQKALAASSITVAALNGWATDTPVDFQLYTTDTQGNIVAGSQSDWTGIVSGTTITQIQLTGGSDDVYPIGTIVVCLPTANWADSLVEGILVEHEQDGTHGDISANSIATDTISEKTAANGVAIDGLNIKDGKLNTVDSVVTANYTDGSILPEHLVTGYGTTWSWQNWTPTFTGLTLGNGTLIARYVRVGKSVNFEVGVVFGSTTAISGSVTFTLPVTGAIPSATNTSAIGSLYMEDNGVAGYGGFIRQDSATTGQFFRYAVSGSNVVTNGLNTGSPFTWATGDWLRGNGLYEAA